MESAESLSEGEERTMKSILEEAHNLVRKSIILFLLQRM